MSATYHGARSRDARGPAQKIAARIEQPSHEEMRRQIRVRLCGFSWQGCLPESVRSEACACKNSREGGVQKSVVLANTVLLGCQKCGNCTLGQLMSPRFESVFFASFLCRYGPRNDAPPRAVANSDKENSSLTQTTNPESTNPAPTPTAKATATAKTRHPVHRCERT